MPNRFYRPSTPQYTSQFVEDKTPYQEMLVSQRYKAAKKEQVAAQYGQLEALNASITAGGRTGDIAPATKNYWNKRLAESADNISSMSVQEATRNLSRLRTEWMNDPNVQGILRDKTEGDPELARFKQSKTFGTDIKSWWNKEEGRPEQFGYFGEIPGVEESVGASQGYEPYETMTYTADYSQPVNQLLKSIPTDTRTARGIETQTIEGKEYKVPWTQRVGFRNLEKDKESIMDQAQNIWDDRDSGIFQSYMTQARGMKGVEDVYDYLVNEYSKLEQRVEYGDRSYMSGYKPSEKEEPEEGLPGVPTSGTTLIETLGEKEGEMDAFVRGEKGYENKPKGVIRNIYQKNATIDAWADFFEKNPDIDIDALIDEDYKAGAHSIRGHKFRIPGYDLLEKPALKLGVKFIKAMSEREDPKFTEDMYPYLDQMMKEHPELIKDLDFGLTYSQDKDKDGNIKGWDLDASNATTRELANVVKNYLNDIVGSIKFEVHHPFHGDPIKHVKIAAAYNSMYGQSIEVGSGGETIAVVKPGLLEHTGHLREADGPRDKVYTLAEIQKEYKIDGLSITEQTGSENFVHPWQFVFNVVGGKGDAKDLQFTSAHPDFFKGKDNQEAFDHLASFTRYNFLKNEFKNNQIYPMIPAHYGKLDAVDPALTDSFDKRYNIIRKNHMPYVTYNYLPEHGHVIAEYDENGELRILNPNAEPEKQVPAIYKGRTRNEVVNAWFPKQE